VWVQAHHLVFDLGLDVDSSKLGKSGLAPLLDIPSISYLVTDGDADLEFVTACARLG
jgi:DeoR/GlpR family transcriptional regulator of sugar metabolism